MLYQNLLNSTFIHGASGYCKIHIFKYGVSCSKNGCFHQQIGSRFCNIDIWGFVTYPVFHMLYGPYCNKKMTFNRCFYCRHSINCISNCRSNIWLHSTRWFAVNPPRWLTPLCYHILCILTRVEMNLRLSIKYTFQYSYIRCDLNSR